MRLRFLLLLFIGFLSNFAGLIIAEEKVCSFSTPMQYKKCLKKNDSKLIPKYPLETNPKKEEKNFLWLGNKPYLSLISEPNYTIIKFKTNDGKNLEVIKSVNKYTFMNGLDWRFKNKITTYIKGEDIISWKSSLIYELLGIGAIDGHTFEINYIDDFGNKESLFFRTRQFINRSKMLDFLFKNASGLDKNEKRDINKLIENKLKNYEKKATILSLIIKKDSSKNTSCFLAKDTDYPDLVNEYNNIYKTINPLRAKLDLPPNKDLKPICS